MMFQVFINFVKQQQEIVAESTTSEAAPGQGRDGGGGAGVTNPTNVINMDELQPFVTSSGAAVDLDILDDDLPTFHANPQSQVAVDTTPFSVINYRQQTDVVHV